MLYIKNDSNDPHYNLAFEEYILKNLDAEEKYIMLWQNKPSVIIGRFQNAFEEVNIEYLERNGVHLVRRITGGGAVYHDMGNLNFTFIEKKDGESIDFSEYAQRIARALEKMGVQTEISGRNDITVDGKKFSGNSQYHYRGKVLHHGTILFNSNLHNVQQALNVGADKYESKSVKSVRSRITNLVDYMEESKDINRFREILVRSLFNGEPVREYIPTWGDLTKIKELMAEKYLTWEWNYGSSPAYNMKKRNRFSFGSVEVRLQVEQGTIQGCKIYGDFFSNEDISELEKRLVGNKHDFKSVASLLDKIDIQRYFGQIENKEFLDLLF